MVEGRVRRLERSVRDLAATIAELRPTREIVAAMTRIVDRHPADDDEPQDPPDHP
jgi:hypothetical protein